MGPEGNEFADSLVSWAGGTGGGAKQTTPRSMPARRHPEHSQVLECGLVTACSKQSKFLEPILDFGEASLNTVSVLTGNFWVSRKAF